MYRPAQVPQPLTKAMFTNKHVVIAMLVAPVLAIMAWFAVDYFIGERPHAAKAGATYTLIAKSSCRYESGRCDLVNGDFEITLRATGVTPDAVALELVSKHALEGATVGLVEAGSAPSTAQMAPTDDKATRWMATLPHPAERESALRVAAVAGGATYYAEVPVVFMHLDI